MEHYSIIRHTANLVGILHSTCFVHFFSKKTCLFNWKPSTYLVIFSADLEVCVLLKLTTCKRRSYRIYSISIPRVVLQTRVEGVDKRSVLIVQNNVKKL